VGQLFYVSNAVDQDDLLNVWTVPSKKAMAEEVSGTRVYLQAQIAAEISAQKRIRPAWLEQATSR
jgi:hypothetical protein